MKTDEITYNQACGKLYQGGVPYISEIFRDEAEANEYLKQKGLQLGPVGQSNFLQSLQKQTLFS